MIGERVHISWKDPSTDWNKFMVLGIDNGMILLRGMDDGETKHDGDKFWAQLSDVSEIFEESQF